MAFRNPVAVSAVTLAAVLASGCATPAAPAPSPGFSAPLASSADASLLPGEGLPLYRTGVPRAVYRILGKVEASRRVHVLLPPEENPALLDALRTEARVAGGDAVLDVTFDQSPQPQPTVRLQTARGILITFTPSPEEKSAP